MSRMNIIDHADKNRVYETWLKSELYRINNKLSDEEIRIIENPDLENDEENRKREYILLYKYNRSAIIDKLPNVVNWYEVEIEESDVDNLFILPALDWFMDTGRTFKLKNTIANLSPYRGHKLAHYPKMSITHHQKIKKMFFYPKDTFKDIIMISSSNNGPFTIIDGTHRSVVLLNENRLSNTKGFLGITDNLSQCFWSIERADIKKYILLLNQLADQRIIW